MILERVNEVVRRTAKLGPSASIDVDQTALRVTLDVIGLVSGRRSDCRRWTHPALESAARLVLSSPMLWLVAAAL